MIRFERTNAFPLKTAPGLLITFPDYDVEDDDEREFWFEITTGGKKSYVSLKEEHEELNSRRMVRDAALVLVQEAAAAAPAAYDGDGRGDDETGGAAPGTTNTEVRYKSVVKPFLRFIVARSHVNPVPKAVDSLQKTCSLLCNAFFLAQPSLTVDLLLSRPQSPRRVFPFWHQ